MTPYPSAITLTGRPRARLGRDGRATTSVVIAVVAVAALASVAFWAWAPLPRPDLTAPDVSSPAESEAKFLALDTTAFRAPLWVAPPAPPRPAPAPPPSPPRPPFKLQLVAIVHLEGTATALFYDPDRDRLLSVAEGQALADATTVERITATGVEIRDGTTVRSLALREDQKGARP